MRLAGMRAPATLRTHAPQCSFEGRFLWTNIWEQGFSDVCVARRLRFDVYLVHYSVLAQDLGDTQKYRSVSQKKSLRTQHEG